MSENNAPEEVRDYQFWQNYRRKNPRQYFQPHIQKQVMDSLRTLGREKFFGVGDE